MSPERHLVEPVRAMHRAAFRRAVPCMSPERHLVEPVRAMHRAAFRRAVRLPCQVVRERDFRLIGGLALDLSPEGMLAVASERVLTGEPVIVSFRSDRIGRWFDAEATIARVLHARRAGDAMPCFGLAFHGTDAAFREGVFRALRRLPPPVPRRPTAPLAAPALTPLFGTNADGRLTLLS
jgi:hypothetical protein